MNKYEVLYIIDAGLNEEETAAQVEKFSKVVTDNGGEVENVNEWGKRRLAYAIDYKTEGYYVLMDFKSSPEFPTELERNFRISEQIMRYMVVRKDDEE